MKKSFVLLLLLSFLTSVAQPGNAVNGSVAQIEQRYRDAKQKGDLNAVADLAVQTGAAYSTAMNYKRSTDFLLVAKEIYKTKNDTKNLAKVSCLLAQNYYRTGNVKRYKDYIKLAEQLIAKDTLSTTYMLLLDTQIQYFKAQNKRPQVEYLRGRKAKLQAAMTPTPPANKVPSVSVTPATPEPKTNQTKVVPADISVQTKETNHYPIALPIAVSIAALAVGGLIYLIYKDRRQNLNFRRHQHEMHAQMLKSFSFAVRDISSGEQISALTKQLAQLAQVKANEKKPDFTLEPIGPFLESVSNDFMRLAAQKKIVVISNIEQKPDRELIDKKTVTSLVELLLSESLLNTAANETMYFSAIVEKRRLVLRVSYPCNPIDKQSLSTLFENLYYEPSAKHPNPIGFALAGALVSWYDGSAEATHDGSLLRIAIDLPLSEPTVRIPKQIPGLVL